MPKSDVVSSRHANLVERDDGYWLYDENSTNGTIVDGIYLESGQSIRLREGSQIQFGETGPVFIFYSGESGSQ
jgi:predicted component of type VI protein secretion system